MAKVTKRLITEYEIYDIETLVGLLAVAMRDIEDALLMTGATPGTDYTRRDLMQWAIMRRSNT